MFASERLTACPRFVLLYAAMYGAFGVASPFLPGFVAARGVAPEELGLVLAAGTALRLISAPFAGRLGDMLQALRAVLVVCTALAGCVTLGYLPAYGFWAFLVLSLLHAAALAPVTIVGGCAGVGRRFTAERERSKTFRIWLGARDRVGCVHRWHLAIRPSGERSRAAGDYLATGHAARYGGSVRHSRAGTHQGAHGRGGVRKSTGPAAF